MLITHGANVNAMDLWQFTPLHEAASKSRTEVGSNVPIIFFFPIIRSMSHVSHMLHVGVGICAKIISRSHHLQNDIQRKEKT